MVLKEQKYLLINDVADKWLYEKFDNSRHNVCKVI